MAQNTIQSDNPYKSQGAIFSEARGLVGVDIRDNPQDIPGNYLLQADNFLTLAGQLIVRPGIQGQLATPPGQASYKLCNFTDGSGNNWILFVSGGKVYKTEQNSSTYTEIKDENGNSYNLGTNVDATIMNGYVYLDDGAHQTIRINLSSGFPAYSMAAPADSPSVQLTSTGISGVGLDPLNATCDLPPQYTPGIGACVAYATLGTGSTAGQIVSITVVAPGYYGTGAAAPKVVINDPTGTGATATASISATTGQITGITVNTPGSNYTAPVVTFAPSSASAPHNAFPQSFMQYDSSHSWIEGMVDYLGWTSYSNAMYGTGGGSIVGTMQSLGAPRSYDIDPNDGTNLQWHIIYRLGEYLNSPSASNYAIQNIQHSDGSGDWATQFVVAFQYYQANVYAGVTVSVQPFQDYQATTPLASPQSVTFHPENATGAHYPPPACSAVFDFSALAATGTPIKSWQVTFTQALTKVPQGNPPILAGGLCISHITGGPVWGNVVAQQVGAYPNGAWAAQQLPLQQSAGGWTADGLPDTVLQAPTLTAFTEDARIKLTFASNRNFQGNEFISVNLKGFLIDNAVPFTYLGTSMELRLFPSSGSPTYVAVDLVIDPSGDFATADISTLTAAELESVSAVEIRFLNNPIAGVTAFAFNFGELTEAGNLGNGEGTLEYLYYVTESIVIDQTTATDTNAATGANPLQVTSSAFANAQVGDVVLVTGGAGWTVGFNSIAALSGTTATLQAAPAAASTSGGHITVILSRNDVVQSNPSLPSPTVTPTSNQAQVSVTIPADCPNNTAGTNPSGQYLMYNLWRLGGQWTTIPLLIASVMASEDVPYGNDWNNPYYSWNHTTGVFLDNTPDLQLSEALPMSYSRDPFPGNAQCNAEWQDRLWKGIGNRLYASWLGSTDTSAPCYTTLVQNADDPNYGTAGFFTQLSPDPTDTIMRLVPFGTPAGVSGDGGGSNQFGGGLLVLCKRSRWVVQGTDATNFEVTQFPTEEGAGLAAFRGVARISARLIAYLGFNRIYLWPPTDEVNAQAGLTSLAAAGAALRDDIGLPIQPALYPAYPSQSTLQNPAAFAQSWMCFHDHYLLVGAPTPGDSQPTVIWVYDMWSGGWTRLTSQQCTSAISCPPNAVLGSALQLMLFDAVTGNVKLLTGTQDQATPGAPLTAIPWTVMVHGMRPGFFYRYKLHPLFYRRGRLEWCEIEMVGGSAGTPLAVTIQAQAWQPVPGGFNPIAGKSFQKVFNLTGGGGGERIMMPPGCIEGEYVTLALSGSSVEQTYIRGIRGWISQTTEDAA